MAYQLRGFVLRLTSNVRLYQLAALGLALGGVIIPLMSGGGGGGGS
jgi:hypothetical protein